jgi:short-subunit dehydrogenase
MSALEVMRPAGSGRVLNLFGRGDKYPVPFQTAYGASKSWIRAFTLGVAKELKDTGVHVHGLNPGLVQTDMLGEIEALPGTEEQLSRLPLINTMWGLPPDEAALPALDLVLGTKVEHQSLGFPQILGRTLGYQAKRLLKRAPALQPMTVRTVAPQSHDRPHA